MIPFNWLPFFFPKIEEEYQFSIAEERNYHYYVN